MKLDIGDQSTIDYLTNSQIKDDDTISFVDEGSNMEGDTKQESKSFCLPYCFINDCKTRKYKLDNNYKANQAKQVNNVSLFNPYDFKSTKSNKKSVFKSKISKLIDNTSSLVSVSDKKISDSNLKQNSKFRKSEIIPDFRFLSHYLNKDFFHDLSPITINIVLNSPNPYEFSERKSIPSFNLDYNLSYLPPHSKCNFFEGDKITNKYNFRGDSVENRLQTLKAFDDQKNSTEENTFRQKSTLFTC